MMDTNGDLLQWVVIFFDKTTSSSSIENKIVSNQELAQELHKPIIRELEKRKVHSSFMDIIWGSDFSDM